MHGINIEHYRWDQALKSHVDPFDGSARGGISRIEVHFGVLPFVREKNDSLRPGTPSAVGLQSDACPRNQY